MSDPLAAPPVNSPAMIGQIREHWHDDLKAADLSDDTQRKYRESITAFVRWLNDEQIALAAVTRRDIVRFRDSQLERYSRSAVNIKLAAIRRFYDFVCEHSSMTINPAARVKCAKNSGRPSGPRRDELTDQEMRQLLDDCATPRRDESRLVCERDRAILYLMAYCGLRTIEVHRADREDLETRRGRNVLWVRRKGRKDHDGYVILPVSVEDAMRSWLNVHPGGGAGPLFVSLSARSKGRRLTTNYIRRMVRRRLDRAGILATNKTTHSLRHSAITRAIRAGANLLQVRRMTGHVKTDTLLGYYHDQFRLNDPPEDRIRYDPPDNG